MLHGRNPFELEVREWFKCFALETDELQLNLILLSYMYKLRVCVLLG